MRSPHTSSLPETADNAAAGGRTWRGYIVAVLTVAGALVLRSWLAPSLGVEVPYLPFFPAILLTSWYGGFGPGVLATVLSTLAAMYFVLPPDGLPITGAADAISIALFLLTSLGIAWLNGRIRRAETAHRLIAAEATRRAERLAGVFNTAVDGIIVIDHHGLIEAFNPGAERLFGYSEHEVRGRNVSMLMPPPYHEEHDAYLSHYLETGTARIIGRGREVTGLRKEGTVFPLHLSVGETSGGGERRFTGILHDLTTRVQIEAQLREQTALARLGEMAAVIAHEVKNPLAGIRGAVQVIGSRLPAGNADGPVLQEIVSRIDALNELMEDLLLFARPPKPRPVPVDVVPLLRTTVDLLSRDPGLHAVTVEIHGGGDAIAADSEMLKIVFHNLLVNAAQAIKGQGTIRVDVQAVDGWCHIAFTDGGPGIPPEIRQNVFTPFFTTKSRGSGLGLATARRLVEAQDGQISLECPPTGGTTVVVRLPAIRA